MSHSHSDLCYAHSHSDQRLFIIGNDSNIIEAQLDSWFIAHCTARFQVFASSWEPIAFICFAMDVAAGNIRNYKLCLTLKKDLAFSILEGSKTYESRKFKASHTKLMKLEVGDVLAFHWFTDEWLTVKILQVLLFASLDEMLQCIPCGQLLPGKNMEDAPKALEKIFRPPTNQMIVFKIGEPMFHRKVPAKAESQFKSKAKAKAKAEALPVPPELPQAVELLQEVAALPDLPAPVPTPVVLPADTDEEPAQQPQEKVHAPEKFQQAQSQYVKEQMKTGVSRKDALKMWMLSNEHADLLNGLPESQLKKRRL